MYLVFKEKWVFNNLSFATDSLFFIIQIHISKKENDLRVHQQGFLSQAMIFLWSCSERGRQSFCLLNHDSQIHRQKALSGA